MSRVEFDGSDLDEFRLPNSDFGPWGHLGGYPRAAVARVGIRPRGILRIPNIKFRPVSLTPGNPGTLWRRSEFAGSDVDEIRLPSSVLAPKGQPGATIAIAGISLSAFDQFRFPNIDFAF